MNSNLNSDDLLKKMEALKVEDVNAFYNVVFNSLLKFPDEAVTDPSPAGSKIKALSSMLDYFEQREEYEKCGFIKNLMDQID
jgi:predicted sugar kinase